MPTPPSAREISRSRCSRRRSIRSRGQPFPGGRIPSFAINPIGAAIAGLYPLPNRSTPFANYVASPASTDDVDQFDGRLDHAFPGASRLTGRYSFSDRRLFEPYAGAGFSTVPGFGNDVERRGQNLSLAYNRPVGHALVNDVRFGYNRVAIGVFVENPQIGNRSVGLEPLATNPRDAGLSLISIGGYSPLGQEYNNPQASTSNAYQLRDTATWARGAHLIKFGGEISGVRQSAYRDVQARGFLTFIDQGYTGNALADLLLGLPVLTGGARLDNPQKLLATTWSAFAHDDWRVLPSLTLSAGPALRLHRPAGRRGRSRQPLRSVDRTAGRGRHRRDAARRLRAGSQQPRPSRRPGVDARRAARTVLRGGYGIYYNQGALATSEGLYFNPPYFNLGVYFPGSAAAAAHPLRPVPGVVPGVHPAVGDRLPARSPDTVDGALERQRPAAVRHVALDRVRLRRLARSRSDLGP